MRHFSTESRFLLVIATLEGRWEGRVGGGKSEVSSAPVYPPDNDKEKHAGGRLEGVKCVRRFPSLPNPVKVSTLSMAIKTQSSRQSDWSTLE